MATTNYGFQTFVNQINQSVTAFNKQAKLMNLARVIHVVYGPTIPGTDIPDRYYNSPNSLGTITYQLFGEAQDRTSQSAGNPTAKPLNGGLKRIPVVGEIVQIIVGTSTMEEDKEQSQYYYTYPLNLWNHPHHNASPDRGDYSDYVNQQIQTYQQSQFSQTPDNPDPKAPINMPLGPGFVEKSTIKALREFPGDVLLEGRWGNSIRFGSTSTQVFRDQNNWSSDSAPGNPITIIRNGQGRTIDQEGYVPTVENINRDPSSIYLTEGQKIVIDDIQNNFSLNSLGIVLQNNITLSIPIQQNLTSYESISAAEQDRIVAETTNPEPPQEQTNNLEQPTTTAETTETTTVPVQVVETATVTPTTTQPVQVSTDSTKGTFIRDFTNQYGNTYELYYKKVGPKTTIYAYNKQTGNLTYTGQPSFAASIEVLAKETEIVLSSNLY